MKQWFANVRTALDRNPGAAVVDGHLPLAATPPSFHQAQLSLALAAIAPHIRWNAPDEHPLIFDDQGRLRPVAVGHSAAAKPGPVPHCGYLVRSGVKIIKLDHRLPAWTWGVRLTYYTATTHDGFVSVDGDHQTIRFSKGLHALILVHHGTAGSVVVESFSAPVCVNSLRVGLLAPVSFIHL